MTDKIAQVTSLLLLIRGEFKRSHRIWGSHLAHLGQQSHLARNEARRFARGWAPCSHRELRQPIFPGTMRSPVIGSSGLEHPGQTQSFSRGYPRRDLGRNKEPVSNHFSDKSANVCKRSAANGSAKKTSPPQNSSFLSCRGGWSRWCTPLECQGEECCCLYLESLQHFNRLLICWPFISVPIFYLVGNFLGPVLKPCSTSLFVGGVFGLFPLYFVLETINSRRVS